MGMLVWMAPCRVSSPESLEKAANTGNWAPDTEATSTAGAAAGAEARLARSTAFGIRSSNCERVSQRARAAVAMKMACVMKRGAPALAPESKRLAMNRKAAGARRGG